MSSLTSPGCTATQYALLSSTYAWIGKIAKGFSGVIVESLSAQHGLMMAYRLFFVGAGAIGIPAILIFFACLPMTGGNGLRSREDGRQADAELRRQADFCTILTGCGEGRIARSRR
jgi:PAT family beta-lactamase induction signal transducer AmpG